ncbi:MAG: ABC transporter permease subunit [Luteitalea sp.]|nr:ABC transporter permease subunit [Luteitalea sp.]
MRSLLTIAHLTLSEARRRRIVSAAALCAMAFLIVFGTALFFAHAEMVRNPRTSFVERQIVLTLLTLAGLYAANFLSVLFAVLLPVDALSGEIDSGVMQTLASKPIRHADIVLGKWLGHLLIVATYLLLLTGGVLLSVWVIAHFAPINVDRALPLMLLEVTLLLTVSIAGGTRLSTVTNGVMALGFYGIAFIGGWVEQVGAFGGIESAKTIGIVASLISPPDAMWRLAAYHLQPPVVRDLGAAVFSVAAVPTPLMVWWAVGFTALTLILAVRSFARRPL